MDEIWGLFTALIAHPTTRTFSLLLSVVSVLMGIYSLRRIHSVSSAQVSNIRAEHLRFLNTKRSEIDLLTLKSPDVADLIAQNFHLSDAKEAQREALLCLYLNVASSAYVAYKNRLIDRDDYDKHMRFIFDDFAGDKDYLWSVIRMNSYPDGFEQQCRIFLDNQAGQRSSRSRVGEQSRTEAAHAGFGVPARPIT